LHCSLNFSYTQYMFTLSQASYDTKEILKWGGLFIAGAVVIILLLRFLLFVKEVIFPTPPPKPTVAFGKLTPQVFPKNATEQTLVYSLNTLTGTLPKLPDQAKVFKIQAYTPDLLGLSKAKEIVTSAGFTQGPNKISDTLFEWSDPNTANLSRKIKINIINYDFNITSDYLNNPAITSGQGLPDQNKAINDAQDLLQSLNSLPSDIDQTKTQANLFSLKNGSLASATSLSNAQVIRVVFHQQDVDKFPIYYEKPDSSNINVLIGAGDKILEAGYIHQAITDEFSTYPLKTAQQIYDELKQGKGYIASYNGSANVSITNVFLAYYIGSQPQEYLMPVLVFEGNNNFAAYVPAITDGWINK